ncbi:MAG: murein biosynthesis integral membrane protein MurJ [Gammaproteobacteria bacterium TMED78]|mgnify:CR=1 FL=1|nr:MAG: murein biosynthesis integral membrane protein MurJ [Gammaproteobacteria bacterium TMED78]|tara:strand:+ start:7819 stop:9435 length:1617 start_codon:yes stop_codon:yes gene_type:complete
MAKKNKKQKVFKRLLGASTLVSAMTFLSRLSGMARDVVFANLFGASIVMDAFFVAFKIPNLLRRFFAEGAFATGFVPIISEYKTNKSKLETKELINSVTGTLATIVFIVSVIGSIASPFLILIFAPGFAETDGRQVLASDMLRITFPYLFFISLTSLAGGILNTYNRFGVPAFTPLLLNTTLIFFSAFIAPSSSNPGIVLAVAVFVAGAIQLFFQIPFLFSLGLLPRPKWSWHNHGVKRILKLMIPVMFGSSVAQINLLFDTLIASFLSAGTISWLYYSDRLVEFPLAIFGIAIATVILPFLSKKSAESSLEEFSLTLSWALRLTIIVIAPAIAGLIILSKPLLITFFYRGAFSKIDVEMASVSLIAYSLGLLFFILVKIFSTGYFSRQDTKTPVRIATICVILNMVFNIFFVFLLLRFNYHAPHAGLALATSISSFINMLLLYRGLKSIKLIELPYNWKILFLKIIISTIIMSLAVCGYSSYVGDWFLLSSFSSIINLLVCIFGGMFIYFLCCYILGIRKIDFLRRVSNHNLSNHNF